MVYAVAAIRGSGKRRALTTWYANSIKIIKQRDAGKRIGRLLAAQTEALMRTALMRRAFLFFRLRAAALVVAAFEARMAVLMDDNVPVDPYVLTIHRKNTQRKYLTVWNRGVAAGACSPSGHVPKKRVRCESGAPSASSRTCCAGSRTR